MSSHGHGDVYSHDHLSLPCQARDLALEYGLQPGGSRRRCACPGDYGSRSGHAHTRTFADMIAFVACSLGSRHLMKSTVDHHATGGRKCP